MNYYEKSRVLREWRKTIAEAGACCIMRPTMYEQFCWWRDALDRYPRGSPERPVSLVIAARAYRIARRNEFLRGFGPAPREGD